MLAMGVTFSGTMLHEAVILLSMVPGRHLQGGSDLPVCPYKANPRTHTLLQECSTHFYMGEGVPTPQY